MVKITWSTLALESVHAASEFHRAYSVGFADELIERVFEKVFLLESHPLMGRIIPELNQTDLRELLYKQYRIMYQVLTPNDLAILVVHHGSKPVSLESLFG
ncbi:type II toxin-antitoxin system RelE/ParE family toxin [Hymenobacter caeli]|uniref:Plasmid stabilization system protein ParE n=1 Tax=Hymenobacter caeli TaxID=2735894 RepID=A0ABX2FTW5_9BACT|nr:type II toxin-antitoxin system RelE/ParE family toxin [Hymenobacter caeli]NRT20407.1 plasmid stabilization system protein ParE [Hymenobacter caeli]